MHPSDLRAKEHVQEVGTSSKVRDGAVGDEKDQWGGPGCQGRGGEDQDARVGVGRTRMPG